KLIPQFFCCGYLFFHLPNVRMPIRVTGTQVAQLCPEFLQLLVDRRQTDGSSIRAFHRTLKRAVLVRKTLQVDALLSRRIQRVLLSLQLGLEALQNLEIAGELPRHLPDMFCLELPDSVFLR